VVVNIMGDIDPQYYGDVMVALDVDHAPDVEVAAIN
jgi:dUTPase